MNKLDRIKNKILTNKQDAYNILQTWRFKEDKIVFTNGCFDIVHRGHLEYLAAAASMGTKMVIGLNTDVSVQNLKGADRPIVDEYSRALLLASFAYVDLVIFFEEETPYDLITFVQPDVLVKGSDYKAKDIVGYDVVKAKGGKIQTLDFIEGFSSTAIINRIKNKG